MDFLGLLRNLFGGGQKASAPPERAPGPWRSGYVEPQPAPSFLQRAQPAARQDASPFPGFQAPASQSFPSFPAPLPRPTQQQQPQQQDQGWNPFRSINFSPPPANAPTPLDLQKPQLEEPFFMRGQKEAKRQVEAQEADEAQNAYFGGEGKYAPEQMSVDAYLSLTPVQRAAVDANTALVQAAEQDVASWAKQQVGGKAIEDKDYLNKVNQTFGEKRGSDTYAPRTMAVLEDLGLNLEGKDLDQYLNFSALVTADDLNTLTPGKPAGDNPRQQNAVAFAEAATTRLSETLASGQTLLDSIRANSDTGRQLFGAPASTDPVGFGNNERDADLKDAFDVLAQTRSQQDLTPETVSGLYAELQTKHGVTPNEVAQFFETRLQSNEYLNAAEDSSVTLGGPGKSLEYLSPADFRSKYLTRGA